METVRRLRAMASLYRQSAAYHPEARNCSQRPSTASTWPLLRSQITSRNAPPFVGTTKRLLNFRHLSSVIIQSHIAGQVIRKRSQSYSCAVLHERAQALVAQLTEMQALRTRLREAEARTSGRRQLGAECGSGTEPLAGGVRVLGEAVGRDQTAVLRLQPSAPVP